MLSHLFRAALLCALTLPAFSQTPKPPYDPNDPEGLVAYPNGTGRYAWKRKGHWQTTALTSPGGNPGRVAPAAPAEIAAMNSTLDALSAILRATQEGGEPVGYWMRDSRTFDYPNAYDLPPGFSAARMPFAYSSGMFPFYISDTLINGKYVQDKGGETQSIYYFFNRLPRQLDRPVIAAESKPGGGEIEFYLRPRITATYSGLPVYEGQDLIVVRQGRSPWAPVALGRALKAAMPRYEKDRQNAEQRLAGLRKQNEETQAPAYEKAMRDRFEQQNGALKTSNPSRYQTRMASLEHELKYNREQAALKANPQRDKDGNWYWNPIDAHTAASARLASLTPEQSSAPACFLATAQNDGRYAIQGDILPAGANPACEDLVSDNHAYFDTKLARSAPQILIVRSIGRCATITGGKFTAKEVHNRISPPQGCMRHVPIWQQMDWAKLAALVIP